jgi:hypothetical protein
VKKGMEGKPPKINMLAQDYPKSRDRTTQSVDGATIYGPFYFLLTPLAIFNVVFQQLMDEKEQRLRLVSVLSSIFLGTISIWIIIN